MSDQPAAEPPQTDPVATPAPPVAARSGLPTSTIVVGAILIAVVGFGLGFFTGHRSARPGFPFARYAHLGAMPWMRAGAMPGVGMPGLGGTGGMSGGSMPGAPSGDQIVAGTITDIRGDSFTVRTLRGDTVTVVTDSSTVVRGVNGGSLSTLEPGDRVLVAGVPQADGSIEATHVVEGLFEATTPGPATGTANG